MKGWEKQSVGDLLTLKRGHDLPSHLRENGIVPIFSSSGISGYHSVEKCNGPGVITGRYGTIGKIFYTDSNYWPLNTTLYVENFNNNYPKFVYYFLQKLDWEQFNDKSAVPGINRNDVHKKEVFFPVEISEQKAIAAVLSSLDDKIDLLHRQNATLEAMAEALFRQWFVVEAKDEWEEKALSSIGNFLNGLACQKFRPSNNIDRLPVLKIKELNNGITNECEWASMSVAPEYVVNSGDVIFSWSGSLMVKIWSGEKCVLNQHLFKVSSQKYPKWFYYFWCKQHLAEFISISESKATTMGHIKRGDLDAAMVKVPLDKDLALMSEIIEPWLAKLEHNQTQIRTLEKLRDTLLPKLMSGEIRVDF